MTKLVQNGIEITAVHNHLLRANPLPWYMHVGGHGDPVKLATAIRQALGESKTPMQAPPSPVAPAPTPGDECADSGFKFANLTRCRPCPFGKDNQDRSRVREQFLAKRETLSDADLVRER